MKTTTSAILFLLLISLPLGCSEESTSLDMDAVESDSSDGSWSPFSLRLRSDESAGDTDAPLKKEGGETQPGEEALLCSYPGEALCPCHENKDCLSSFCVEGTQGAICTTPCLETCPEGFSCEEFNSNGPDVVWVCMPKFTRLCRPCKNHADCQDGLTTDNRCVLYGEEGSFCGTPCELDEDCPEEYVCNTHSGHNPSQCVLFEGECSCSGLSIAYAATTLCTITSDYGSCAGDRVCSEEALAPCDAPNPIAEVCNGMDDDCDGSIDEDFESLDCNINNDEGTCPGILVCEEGKVQCQGVMAKFEICDGLDNNCNGSVDEAHPDLDGDGTADCVDPDRDGDGTPNSEDCAPDNPAIAPGAVEICNGLDDDCDNAVDPPGSEGCSYVYPDEDSDGFGSDVGLVCLCVLPSSEYVSTGGDCNDLDPTISPEQAEKCDDIDNNCNGITDEGCDDDKDQFCDSQMETSDPPPEVCPNGGGDCDDTLLFLNPSSIEICDGKDNNCDAVVDEGCDDDGDGYCDQMKFVVAPTPDTCPLGAMDCDDEDPEIHPGKLDYPDASFLDVNCDGLDGNIEYAVFVDVVGGKDTNPGTMNLPVKTLSTGISLAKDMTKFQVLVSKGIYNEQVTMQPVVGVYGAYDAGKGWKRSFSNESRIYNALSKDNRIIAVRAEGILPKTRIQLMKIEAGASGTNGSSYGIYAKNGNGLIVEYCDITTGDGGAGVDGVQGGGGNEGNSGFDGEDGADDSTKKGSPGEGGASFCALVEGAGGTGGKGGYGDNGGMPGVGGFIGGGEGGSGGIGGNDCNDSGEPGLPGYPGANGSNGFGGDGGAVTAEGFWHGWPGMNGWPGNAGFGGGGGGGGAGGSACASCYSWCELFGSCLCNADRGGGGGGGGAGGCPAKGATGGTAGGGSFGIFLLDASPTIVHTHIHTGSGGDGGKGKSGGWGGSGGLGGLGGNGPDDSGSGGSGGQGGKGGNGGASGGGAGGPSVGIFPAGGSLPNLDTSTVTYIIGPGGLGGWGGPGGVNKGAKGASKAVY